MHFRTFLLVALVILCLVGLSKQEFFDTLASRQHPDASMPEPPDKQSSRAAPVWVSDQSGSASTGLLYFAIKESLNSYSNVWWDPAQPGQGIQIVHDGNAVSGAWYLYDESGNGMWVTFVGQLSGTTLNAELLRFTGPALGSAFWDSSLVKNSSVGSVIIDFSSEYAASFTYVLNGVANTMNLEPYKLTGAETNCQSMTLTKLEMTQFINEARGRSRSCGNENFQATDSISWNETLSQAALNHSQDMATNNFFSHTGSDGLNPGARIELAGYIAATWGENISAGRTTSRDVVDGWLNSPGHCANIMNADFTEIGSACAENESSDYETYWTLVLAAPR